jgi:ribonuclease BN (tRNA processing enzyme)
VKERRAIQGGEDRENGPIMGEVRVQFLGSGDAFGSGGRFQTCIYVDEGRVGFLLDCGASSLIAMRRWDVNPSLIDIIVLSHLHGDHFGGLPFFVLDAQLISRRTKPLVVAGPPGLESRIRDAMEVLFPGSSRVQGEFPLEFVELTDGSPTKIGPLVVTPYGVIHASGAPPYALRVEAGGKIIGYSGDTEWTDTLIRASQGADLFVCEAYFFEKGIKYHLDYRTLMAHRGKLGCRRLVLTHMSHDMLDRIESLDVECAEDGKQIVV